MIVIGIDAATWDIIRPNIDRLPNLKRLMDEGEHDTIHLTQKPWSPSVWCSMFSGKTPEEHGHKDFVENGEIVKRQDINVDFIWDLLDEKGISVKAVNVPFIVPPYSYNIDFKPVAGGVPVETEELLEEIEAITSKSLEVLQGDKPEVYIAVYTALDKLSHHHWGESILVDYYVKVDEALGKILPYDDEVIVISDHGMCDYDKAPVQTLPKETPKGIMKGDHHPDAVIITRNIDFKIEQPMDVFKGIYAKYIG